MPPRDLLSRSTTSRTPPARSIPSPVPERRHPDAGRRGRVGHQHARPRRRATGSRCSSELRFPHSLGLLYSAFTYFTGFKVNSGEYKLMGLAPYGEPTYANADPREPARPARRRLVPPEHGLLRLPRRPDDDERAVRRSCSAGRRASRSREITRARDGPRRARSRW